MTEARQDPRGRLSGQSVSQARDNTTRHPNSPPSPLPQIVRALTHSPPAAQRISNEKLDKSVQRRAPRSRSEPRAKRMFLSRLVQEDYVRGGRRRRSLNPARTGQGRACYGLHNAQLPCESEQWRSLMDCSWTSNPPPPPSAPQLRPLTGLLGR